jgi:pilus assembly protein CpaC
MHRSAIGGSVRRHWALGIVIAITAFLLAPLASAQQRAVRVQPAQQAGELVVALDKSELLRVDQSFDEVSVGNPEIADVVPLTRDLIYVLGKRIGSTSLTILGPGGRVIAVVDVTVTFDIAGLKGKLFELLPGERIEVRPAGGAIVLSGNVSSADRLARALALAERYAPERVTNLLQVSGNQQVMLQVRFAEVQRSVAKELGIDSAFLDTGGGTRFGIVTGTGANIGRRFGQSIREFATGFLHVGDLDLAFDVLEDKGLVRTLAEPNLVTLSGDTASFLAGGEFPIPVAQEEDTITIEFKEFGVALAFTPTVVGKDLINLVVNTEVSAIDPTLSVQTTTGIAGGISVPGLTVRRANTTVELGDGQGFAIAGLLQDDFRDNIRQFPWLGDLPVIGALLRSTAFLRRQTELVILITPRLVRAVAPSQLNALDDRMVVPSEADLFLLGRVQGGQPWPGTVPPQGAAPAATQGASEVGLDGPYGYILK